MLESLLNALTQLDEPTLTEEVLVPLISRVHPGRVEYTHSSVEAGRDLVSFGTDSIGREHILCVQVKARKVSYGAAAIGEVLRTALTARREAVTTETGKTCTPNEVWYITSFPFPENERRQVASTLEEMTRNNVKFIPGEELALIIEKQLPELAAKLLNQEGTNIIQFISRLAVHREGRAFGFSHDRDLTEFYVTATISLGDARTSAMLDNSRSIVDIRRTVSIPMSELVHVKETCRSFDSLQTTILNRAKKYIELGLPDRAILKCDFTNTDLISVTRGHFENALGASGYGELLDMPERDRSPLAVKNALRMLKPILEEDQVEAGVLYRFGQALAELKTELKTGLKKCPAELSDDCGPVSSLLTSVARADALAEFLTFNCDVPIEASSEDELGVHLKRIKVSKPAPSVPT